MTEDDISRGLSTQNILTGVPYPPVDVPCYIESTVAVYDVDPNCRNQAWVLKKSLRLGGGIRQKHVRRG